MSAVKQSYRHVKQKDNQGGESSKEVRFSKYTDDDKVVVNIDLTDSGGAGLPSQQYLALGSGFVVKYSVGVGTAGGGTVDGYSDLKARVIVKRGSTVISEFQDAEFVGVTAGQAYTFDASPYLFKIFRIFFRRRLAHHKLDESHLSGRRIVGDGPGRRLCQPALLPELGHGLFHPRLVVFAPIADAHRQLRPPLVQGRLQQGRQGLCAGGVHHRLDLLCRAAVADLQAPTW